MDLGNECPTFPFLFTMVMTAGESVSEADQMKQFFV